MHYDHEYYGRFNYVEILSTFNLVDIAFIKSILDGEEIDYYLRGENFNYIDQLIQPVTLFVREDQAFTVKELLKDLPITYLGLSFKQDLENDEDEEENDDNEQEDSEDDGDIII